MGLYDKRLFEGGCLDTGAEQSVVGLIQEKEHMPQYGKKLTLGAVPTIYKFADGYCPRKRKFEVRILLPDGRFIKIIDDVVEEDIPLLIVMGVMTGNKLLMDFY